MRAPGCAIDYAVMVKRIIVSLVVVGLLVAGLVLLAEQNTVQAGPPVPPGPGEAANVLAPQARSFRSVVQPVASNGRVRATGRGGS